MKKNYLIGLSALLLVGVMTSCGQKPTPEPTAEPTAQPTGEQTAQPTAQPTVQPTVDPSNPLAGTYDITVWVSELEGVKELTEREISEIKSLIENKVPTREICIKYNIKNSVVKNLIAKNTEGKSDKEITDDELRSICEDMMMNIYSLTQLANKHNVKRSIVASIHYRRPKFKYIWKEYFEE